MINSAVKVIADINAWKNEHIEKADLMCRIAEDEVGWPYAWGATGQRCTVSNRQARMNNPKIGDGDKELIRKRCQVLNGSDSDCTNCKYYPGGERTRIFDCRGFTRWCIQQVGITIQGAGATSQYNTAANWEERGLIRDMPKDRICCVFQDVNGTKEHTGLALGDQIIHCSVEVKRGHTYDKGWTHYAVPKGVDGSAPVPEPSFPTIRRGSRGEYVTLAQTKLKQLGYNIGNSGIDGIFGKATEAAVKQFQRDWELKEDGIIGPKTWAQLLGAPIRDNKYTVTIRGLTKEKAEELKKQYPDAEIKEEG